MKTNTAEAAPDFGVRTLEEARARHKTLVDEKSADIFGFSREVLTDFFVECYKPEFAANVPALTRAEVLKRMSEYLVFAFEKAEDHRGLSAGRSVQKLTEWLWLLKDEEAFAFASDEANYPQYGMPVLKYIAKRYGLPVPARAEKWEDGKPCSSDCAEGCGQ